MKAKKSRKRLWIIFGLIIVILAIFGGIFLQTVCCSVPKITDMTDAQLRSAINKSLSGDDRLAFYPMNRLVQVKQGSTNGIAMGINNLFAEPGSKDFSYTVSAKDISDCGISEIEAGSWIISGKQGSVSIPHDDFSVQKVFFEVPKNAPLCIARFRVDVSVGGTSYATDLFDVEVKRK